MNGEQVSERLLLNRMEWELKTEAQTVAASAERQGWRVEDAFRESARQWSDLVALEINGRTVTYAELERRSEGLAARLAQNGIGRGDIVGLACEDIGQFAVGALSILKAGAAYLSLDMRYPLSRTPAAVFEDAVKLLIGEEYLIRDIPSSLPTLAFNPEKTAQSRAEAPCPPKQSNENCDPAYLCYTSGTTGVAKGALIPHGGIRGLVSHPQFEAFKPGGRIASCSTFAFDAITFEVWGALLNGCCLVQVPLEVVRSPGRLADFLSEERIDGAFLTTSLFNAVATHRADAFGTMTTLVIGGEAVQPAYVQRVFDSGFPPRQIINGYGPTETTTFATCHAITPADLASGAIPIGRPISGREAYIVTSAGRQAEPGEEGELCIGGEAVALGYLDAPDLTAERFVSNVLLGAFNTRLYRTGDLCKTQDDGAIQYLGRLDEQVKVKGYRIEPAGVALLLGRIAGVEEAVVVPREVAFGAKQIVGFLRGDGRLSEVELHAAAVRLMPDYMVPAALAWVDDFPLNANGKLDTAALFSKLEAQRCGVFETQGYEELERELADIWRRNGSPATFDLDTPFHQVCDSLAMVGVMLDIEAAFGRELPISALILPVTIRSMAAALRAPKVARAEPARVFYVGQPWNMTPMPEALGAALDTSGPCLELRVPPAASSNFAYDSIEDLGEILEKQVLDASDGRPYTVVGFSFGGILAFELARRLERRGEKIERLLILDSRLARRRLWLGRVWVRFRQLLVYARRDPRQAWERVARRTRWMIGRETPNRAQQINRRALEAMLSYAPDPISVPTVFVKCMKFDDAFDNPKNSIYGKSIPWNKIVSDLKVVELNCTHAQIVHDPTWASKVAD